MTRLLNIWRRHKVLVTGFLVALGFLIFFATRMILFMIYWADPAHRDQAIAGWMTPGYVVHSWRIPDQVMIDTIGPKPDRRRPKISDFADARGITTKDLITRIEAAIAQHRASKSPSE